MKSGPLCRSHTREAQKQFRLRSRCQRWRLNRLHQLFCLSYNVVFFFCLCLFSTKCAPWCFTLYILFNLQSSMMMIVNASLLCATWLYTLRAQCPCPYLWFFDHSPLCIIRTTEEKKETLSNAFCCLNLLLRVILLFHFVFSLHFKTLKSISFIFCLAARFLSYVRKHTLVWPLNTNFVSHFIQI